MTTPELTDFSDFLILPFYEVASQLAKETRKPITFWLFTLSSSACTEKEPPAGNTTVPLFLLPDDSWQIIQAPPRQRRIRSYGLGPDGKMINPAGLVRAENTVIEWKIKKSCLCILRQKHSPYETDGTREALELEGVSIYRPEFYEWCNNSNYELPRFWFTDEERQRISKLTTPTRSQTPPPPPQKKVRMNPLKALILKLIQEGIKADKESIWLALIDKAGEDSCIICGTQDGEGSVIQWQTANGKITKINKNAVAQRLKTYRTEGLIP